MLNFLYYLPLFRGKKINLISDLSELEGFYEFKVLLEETVHFVRIAKTKAVQCNDLFY